MLFQVPDGQLEGRDDISEWDDKHEQFRLQVESTSNEVHYCSHPPLPSALTLCSVSLSLLATCIDVQVPSPQLLSSLFQYRFSITHLGTIWQAHLVLYGDTVFEQLANEHRGVMEDELLTRYNTLSLGISGEQRHSTILPLAVPLDCAECIIFGWYVRERCCLTRLTVFCRRYLSQPSAAAPPWRS